MTANDSAISPSQLPPCALLREIYTSGKVTLDSGEQAAVSADVGTDISGVLYRTVVTRGARQALEIGMAYGVSTLSILTGLAETDGSLVSVDPYFGWDTGRRTALANVERAGFSARHNHRHAPSFEALPALHAEGRRFDFIYIDGAHDYDNVFIDWFYARKMLEPGGVIGFNDVGWAGVWPVVKRAIADPEFAELDVGLPADYRGRTIAHTAARRALGWSRQDRFFVKRAKPSAAGSGG